MITENNLIINKNIMITFIEEQSFGYRARTIKNASADITIAFAIDFNTAGEILTRKSVLAQNKLYFPIDLSNLQLNGSREDLVAHEITKHDCRTINIAGNGIYTFSDVYTQGVLDDFVYCFLENVLRRIGNHKILMIRSGGQTGIDEAGAKAGDKLGIETLVLAPKGWVFRDINGIDIANETKFMERFRIKC